MPFGLVVATLSGHLTAQQLGDLVASALNLRGINMLGGEGVACKAERALLQRRIATLQLGVCQGSTNARRAQPPAACCKPAKLSINSRQPRGLPPTAAPVGSPQGAGAQVPPRQEPCWACHLPFHCGCI